MAITLIVEDGTGKDDANALVSLNDAKAYWDGRGTSYVSFTDDALSGAIVRASAFLGAAYQWRGDKINGRAQTMPWPRSGVTDRDGYDVADNEVPREIIAACCEIALFEATTPGGMNPSRRKSRPNKSAPSALNTRTCSRARRRRVRCC